MKKTTKNRTRAHSVSHAARHGTGTNTQAHTLVRRHTLLISLLAHTHCCRCRRWLASAIPFPHPHPSRHLACPQRHSLTTSVTYLTTVANNNSNCDSKRRSNSSSGRCASPAVVECSGLKHLSYHLIASS